MATTENKAVFRRTFEELFSQGNLIIADEVIAPDFLNHAVPASMINHGPESMRQVVTMLRTAFPDLHFTLEELVGEGETVAARVIMSGTHQGFFQGLPPTGLPFQQAQMHFVHFREGQAVAHWAVRDDLGLQQQLSLMPPPTQEE